MNKKEHMKAILEFLSRGDYHRIRPRKLARKMGVSGAQYGEFRAAYKELRDSGRLVLGAQNALTLPAVDKTITGRFKSNPRGFGFIVPDDPDTSGDLFVPASKTGGAMSGDLVKARVINQGKRQGKMKFAGEIIDVLERGLSRLVGTLEQAETHWFVIPDGRRVTSPVVIRDIYEKEYSPGAKVVIEITTYPSEGELAEGVIVERLGERGELYAEIDSTIRAFGIPHEFPSDVLEQSRQAALSFKAELSGVRKDFTGITTITIDPDTAKDYDDAISLEKREGGLRLGVHIADVSHFVSEGSPLDVEARKRGTSVYFPRKVVPMLPETLSNGVCSLQEGVDRFVKTAFIDYDDSGTITGFELAEGVIRSDKRLTYTQAQAICDGEDVGVSSTIATLVKDMEALARKIEKRRRGEGMLHLDLPEVELILDEEGKVADAQPADDAYTHTIIEMFMVEANDVVARFFAKRKEPLIRRIHPSPDDEAVSQLQAFAGACGHHVPDNPTRQQLQALVDEVSDLPESHAINLAVLRSFQKATYALEEEGHFALASEHYCHFTSPIRRYPDLTVHRTLARYLKGEPRSKNQDREGLEDLAHHLSVRERNAESAELELKQVMILHHLARSVGSTFDGVITGVADFGIFVQFPKFQVEGVIRLPDLGDDWWDVSAKYGTVRGEVTGVTYRIGDPMEVRIAKVDIPMRQMDLVPAEYEHKNAVPKKPRPKPPQPSRRRGRRPGEGRRQRRG